MKSLVTQGLLSRTRSKSDGRSSRFDLTERGRVVHGQDPFADLARAIAELPQGLQAELRSTLERVTGRIAHDRQRPSFGPCTHCRFLEKCVLNEDNVPHFPDEPDILSREM
jgi:hypothetical protein